MVGVGHRTSHAAGSIMIRGSSRYTWLRTILYLCFPPIIGFFVVCPTDPNPPLPLARRPNRDGSHRRALLDPLLHMHKKGRELQNQEERLNRILSHHCCKFTLYLHAHGPVSCLCGERNYKQAAPTPVFCYYKQAAQDRGFVTTSRRHNTGFCYYKQAVQHTWVLFIKKQLRNETVGEAKKGPTSRPRERKNRHLNSPTRQQLPPSKHRRVHVFSAATPCRHAISRLRCFPETVPFRLALQCTPSLTFRTSSIPSVIPSSRRSSLW